MSAQSPPSSSSRRALLRLGALGTASGLWASLAGCAGTERSAKAAAPWQERLNGDTVALLGEVHDNAEGQRKRLLLLRRAIAAGWRPVLAMEQFDVDRQGDIDRARHERPGDADFLVAAASPARAGWDWPLYKPLIALALANDLPLLAANLSRGDASRLVRDDYASAFGAARAQDLGFGQPPAADWQAAQQREVDAGHCGTLPASLLPGMARAQFGRDAVMADLLHQHASARGIVLIAGNGHVRRDLGVPRWLATPTHRWADGRVLAVGFVEQSADAPGSVDGGLPESAFDAVVVSAPAPRDADPCAAFRQAPPSPTMRGT